jgi:hypothetical protein
VQRRSGTMETAKARNCKKRFELYDLHGVSLFCRQRLLTYQTYR